MIVDSHAHVDESEIFGWLDPPEALINLMDEAGISRAVVMTYVDVPGVDMRGLKYIAEVVRRYPDRLVGYARMNPYGEDAISLFREAILELRLKGLKLHPESITNHPYANQSMALIKEAARLRAPVLFHSGDECMSLPLQIGLAAQACPDAKIILGHMGGYSHTDDALAMAERYDNIFLDTSAMPYPAKIREAVGRIGAERIMFASDGPGCNPALEVEKVRQVKLSPKEEERVFYENILTLLEEVNTK
jgi:predicted TIM-barrel fold metal-dependent hydrolase